MFGRDVVQGGIMRKRRPEGFVKGDPGADGMDLRAPLCDLNRHFGALWHGDLNRLQYQKTGFHIRLEHVLELEIHMYTACDIPSGLQGRDLGGV